MVYQPGMVPTWLASQPSVPDFSCGFQFHFSLGMRSRTLRVLAISWSNSGSRDCAMDIRPPKAVDYGGGEYRGRKSELLTGKKGRATGGTGRQKRKTGRRKRRKSGFRATKERT